MKRWCRPGCQTALIKGDIKLVDLIVRMQVFAPLMMMIFIMGLRRNQAHLKL